MSDITAEADKPVIKNALSTHSAAFSLKRPANDNLADKEIAECLEKHASMSGSERYFRTEKKFWKSLSPSEFKSAQQLYYGFQLLVSGIGYRTQSFSGMPVTSMENTGHQSDIVSDFQVWIVHARGNGVCLGAFLDLLVFGQSCREIDRSYRRRKGFAKDNLVKGLTLYLDLKKHYFRE
ncbi:MAG: hypothetical protein MI743_11685 [Sneathiellales bacterium]|nr:hypothetical protein [Sneathiellales bacterium]